MLHWLEIWCLFEMMWLFSWRCGASLVGYVVVYWLEMWCFIGWRCSGSLVGDVVVHWLEM